VASKRFTAKDSGDVYRGPIRKKRQLVGVPGNFIPVPISRFAARIQPTSGIVAKFGPDTQTKFKKFDVKTAGSF